MKHTVLILMLAASAAAAVAQTPAKPATTPAAKPAKPAVQATAAPSPLVAAYIKAPANIPQYKGIQHPVFTIALRYQEIKIGTGAVAETGKVLKLFYTGYRAADGVKFDSTADHPRQPLKDKDGKPVLGDDGKPKLGDIQPFPFHQGIGNTIPGFDQGFVGMKVGGKRRIFIPWQLGYGTRAIPDRGAEHPGIPAKSDLIFDVELLDVADAPPPPAARPMGAGPGGRPMPPGVRPPQGATPGAPGTAPPIRLSPAPAPAAPAPTTPPAPQTTPPPASSTPAKPPATTPPTSTTPATPPPPATSTPTTTPPPAATPQPQLR
jgi:peptidylprolyl isomerase